ncbi:DNA cytosine methyltransferase [Enterococcus entomosocium]|uniref:DNA cytosine methyltransferase n=1 Tax=Enterococcus entomosocium TaxID=3034352 RepID=UPI003B5C6691
MLKVLDLFSGAGGLSEGFRNNEVNILCHVEMDRDACYSLKTREAFHYLNENDHLNIYYDYLNKRINRQELYDSIPDQLLDKVINFEINSDNIERIFQVIDEKLEGISLDGIIGGPPCQAYSTIGRARNKGKKENDSRIYLYEYYVEFLRRYSPNFFVFENVKGLLSFKDIHNELLFPKITDAFLKSGYDLEYKILNSKDFGVSQKRERLFLVGTKKNLNTTDSFFKILDSFQEESPNLFDLFMDLPKLKSGESNDSYLNIEPSKYINSYFRKNIKMPLTYHIARPQNYNDLLIYKIVAKEKNNGKNLHYYDLPKDLQTHNNKRSFIDRYKALDGNSYSHTVVAHISKDGHYYIHPDIKQNRSISVREAARIQGFPDDYFFESSRTAAFKQIGNAVPPILSNKIYQAISKMFEQKE